MRSATFNWISATVTLLLLLGLGLAIRWVVLENAELSTMASGRQTTPQASDTESSSAQSSTAQGSNTAVVFETISSTRTAPTVAPTQNTRSVPESTPVWSPGARATGAVTNARAESQTATTLSPENSNISATAAPSPSATEAPPVVADLRPTAIPTRGGREIEPTGTEPTGTEPTGTGSPEPVTRSPGSSGAVATVPAPSLVLLSNGNYANDLALSNGIVWTATDGGVVAWNQQNGSVSKFTTLDGLLHNVSTTVVDCPLPGLGVVFGTVAGLQIFSWESGGWRTLNSSNSPMAFDDVGTLYCDAATQTLLVGYIQHGLDLYSGADSSWTYIDQNSGLISNRVYAALVTGRANGASDDSPVLWVAQDDGVAVLAGETATTFNASNSPLAAPVIALTTDEGGDIWLATASALYRAPSAAATDASLPWQVYNRESAGDTFPTGTLVDVAASPEGTVWLGFEDGTLCGFDPASEECVQRFEAGDASAARANGPLTSVYVDDAGTLYYTTSGQGYSQFDAGAWQSFTVPDEPLPDNHIRSLAQDTNGTVWIATRGGVQRFVPVPASSATGVYDTTPARFDPFDSSMVSRDVRVIRAGVDDSMWFGSDAVGRYTSQGNGGDWSIYTSLNGLAGTPIHSIDLDAVGRAWIGTGGGLTIHTQDSLFSLTQAEGLPSNTILALLATAEDDNSMWIGTGGGGLLRARSNQIDVFNQQSVGLPSNVITALAHDADGSLLVGTDRGLARFVDGQTTQIRSVGTVEVTALATDGEGIIWVGTADSGAYYFNGLAWQQFTTSDNLPSQHITALLIDANNVAWIGGDNGGLLQFYHAGP